MTYNGWSNRATWNVSLWMNNDEGTYRQVQAILKKAKTEAEFEADLRDFLCELWSDGKTPDGCLLIEANLFEIAESEWSDREVQS